MIFSFALLIGAVSLDFIIGDPEWLPHPVVLMGKIIDKLRESTERVAGKRIWMLKTCGALITITVVLIFGLLGWLIERLALPGSPIPKSLGFLILLISLSSSLASKSLLKSVNDVLESIPEKKIENNFKDESIIKSRQKLGKIVGRDVKNLSEEEILRAVAETASESYVDGVFSPVFWIFTGLIIWKFSLLLPGPLSLAWSFKATSTLDSMLGYKYKHLKWLGKTSARLDDILNWVPCRLVLFTLPLISKPIYQYPRLITNAFKDGSKDSSPNSGISEAIFAYCANVQMGGTNSYNGKLVFKSILAENYPKANKSNIKTIMILGFWLLFCWVLAGSFILYLLN